MPLELDLGYKTLPSVTDEYENTAVCSIALTNIFCSCCGKERCVSIWLVFNMELACAINLLRCTGASFRHCGWNDQNDLFLTQICLKWKKKMEKKVLQG